MTDNELLLAISNIVQAQIDPIKTEIQDIRSTLADDMITKKDLDSRLTKSENMILNELDRVQEKTC